MSRRNRSYKTFLSVCLLGASLDLVVSACNSRPIRPLMVGIGAAESNPEHESKSGDNSEEPSERGEAPMTGQGEIKKGEVGEKPMAGETPDKPPVVTPPVVTPPVVVPPVVTPPKTLVECPNKLSVGRIHQWHATQEGMMIPSEGLIVVKDGDHNVAKVEFVGEGWHVLPVWLKNAYEAEVDLSKSKAFTMTYSATADMFVQLRPAFKWSGGEQWAAKIPSTGGVSKTLLVSFEDATSWTAPLGQPPHTLNEARAKARGFVFIGNKPTKFAVTSLLIDGYEPPCE